MRKRAPTAKPQASLTVRQPIMMDVARLAGVSMKTVSRVVNKEPNVREEVREREIGRAHV